MDTSKYLGILRWSLQYTDGTKESDANAMDPETRAWLKEAIESQVVDPAEQMKALVKVLQVKRGEPEGERTGDSGGADAAADSAAAPESDAEVAAKAAAAVAGAGDYVQNKVDALVALQDWVEQIDWAADLHQIGGFKTVIELMSAPEEEIRVRALEVFATVVQNNPKPQEWAMEMGSLPILVTALAKEGLSGVEQAKTMLALACLIRECTPATVQFIKDHKGVALLMRIINDGAYDVKAQRKALFLMRYLLAQVPAIRIALAEPLAQTLNAGVLSTDIDLRENSLHLLQTHYKDPNVLARLGEGAREATLAALAHLEEGGSRFDPEDERTHELVKALKPVVAQPPLPAAAAPAAGDTPLLAIK